MIIMALDHIRDLIHVNALTQDPTNLETTTPWLFMTRWITHLCAPTFVFLAGTSVFLASTNKPLRDQQRFLLTRGLWLILLEFTVINFGIWWNLHFEVFIFQVIGTFGFGFIALSFLIRFPAKNLGITGIAIICLHGLISAFFATSAIVPQSVSGSAASEFNWLSIASPFMTSMVIPLPWSKTLIIGYPPIPWLGIMLAGYGAGKFFQQEQPQRIKTFLRLALILFGTFLVIRLINLYGDPVVWSEQKNALYTILSFINVSKYPPSFLYTCITLSLMFLMLAGAEKIKSANTVFETYGRVPLFYYLVHWYLIHLTMFAVLFAQGFGFDDFRFGFNFGRPEGVSGLELGWIYLIWITVILILYPLCKWYNRMKSTNSSWIFRYL